MTEPATAPAAAAAPSRPGEATVRFSRRRALLVWSLVVVGTLLLLISSLTVWAKRQIISTDGYVNTTTQMIQNEEIRNTVSNYAIDTLYTNVDVAALLQKRLPAQTQALAPVAAAGLRQLSLRATQELLASPRFQSVWEEANRRAHERLMAILNGQKTGRFETANGAFVLDLQPMIQRLSSSGALGARIAAQLPPNAGQITILKSDQLKSIQDALKVLKALTIFLAIAAIALFAAAIAVGGGRRRNVLRASAVAFVFVGLIVLVLRRIVGVAIVNNVVHTESAKPAASAAWSIGSSDLREIGIALVIYGVVALVGAWLAGPTRPAVAIRQRLAPTFRNRPGVVYGVVGVVYLLVILWAPTPALSRWWGILLFAALIAIGIAALQRQTVKEFPGSEQEPEPEPA
jgi:heme/copper-type cytochrome/quinol oxidase subunit 3